MVPQSSQRRKFAGLAGCWAFGAAPSSRGSKRQLYCCCLFHFLGSKTSHCSPAASSNSGSASHAHRIAPAGSTLRASRDLREQQVELVMQHLYRLQRVTLHAAVLPTSFKTHFNWPFMTKLA